jgi:transposase-like protein
MHEITTPEFCSNPRCIYHQPEVASGAGRWYHRSGSFHTACRGQIQRFRCLHCGKSVSTQTFSIHYWTHSTCDLKRLREDLDSTSGLRQIARRWKGSYRVVQNRITRLSHSALALMDAAGAQLSLSENLVIDGFESFVRSQYFPLNVNIAAGADSQFLYALSLSPLRRKGRMSRLQRHRRAMIDAHWRAPRASVRAGMQLILEDLSGAISRGCAVSRLVIYSDEHKSYPPAIAATRGLVPLMHRSLLSHVTVSSKVARTVRNRLFAVNYIERQIRKNAGDHVRETVKQARETNCMMQRLALFAVSHNFFTPHRVSDHADCSADRTHATVAGLEANRQVQRILSRFYTHRHLWAHLSQKPQWIKPIWHHTHDNPPAVDFTTGRLTAKPAACPLGPIAAHLVA